ncbi:MAG: glycosyltransferase [Pseudomonadota bacterium]
MSSLRILHVIRAPVGGLFRHVRDLAIEQSARGYEVGLLADENCRDGLTAERLLALEPHLGLGVHLAPMSRNPGFMDFSAVYRVKGLVEDLGIHVVHGHGAKGGAYARLGGTLAGGPPGSIRPGRFYTPHGGSLHYRNSPVRGGLYRSAEKVLGAMTDGILFESEFAAAAYHDAVRPDATIRTRVVSNGLSAHEFDDISINNDATDFLFIGELRHLKGVDLLLNALANINSNRSGSVRPVGATIVGDGPDAKTFHAQAETLGLSQLVRFTGAMPAPQAFPLGRCVVMPSRAESLPYIALEAAAAARPLIATDVGGVPEIVRGADTELVRPDDAAALSDAMSGYLSNEGLAQRRALTLRRAVAERFSLKEMTGGIEDFYFDVLGGQSTLEPARPSLAIRAVG